jgi:hypothetical protein
MLTNMVHGPRNPEQQREAVRAGEYVAVAEVAYDALGKMN